MRYRVVIQTRGTANATTGVVGASANTTVWAEVVTQAGGPENEQNDAVAGVVNHIVRVRSPLSVTAKDKLVWNGKTLLIQNVRMLDRSYLELNCIEGQ
jgi:hypothetical protein